MKKASPLPWEKIPWEYLRQLYMFVPPDLYYLLGIGAQELSSAVERIRAGLEEARRLFDESSTSAENSFYDEQKAALRHYPTEGSQGKDLKLVWHYETGFEERVTPDGPDVKAPADALSPEERWTHWANWKAAEYMFCHEIDGIGLPTGKMTYPGGMNLIRGPLLVLEVPRDEDRTERAVRLAREWTADGAPRREDFRLKRCVAGGPNIPGPLAEKVAFHIGVVGKNSVRDILVSGGFRLPDDLTWVKKPKKRK